jgi:hypothetical protein
MNLKLAKQHHTKAGSALAQGDAKTAMHHVGHIMAALKAPAVTTQPQPAAATIPPDQSFGGVPVGSNNGGNWIAGATSNKGALHAKLGVPAGEKIPAKKLAGAEKSSNPTERKEANLARTLKSFNHSKK